MEMKPKKDTYWLVHCPQTNVLVWELSQTFLFMPHLSISSSNKTLQRNHTFWCKLVVLSQLKFFLILNIFYLTTKHDLVYTFPVLLARYKPNYLELDVFYTNNNKLFKLAIGISTIPSSSMLWRCDFHKSSSRSVIFNMTTASYTRLFISKVKLSNINTIKNSVPWSQFNHPIATFPSLQEVLLDQADVDEKVGRRAAITVNLLDLLRSAKNHPTWLFNSPESNYSCFKL